MIIRRERSTFCMIHHMTSFQLVCLVILFLIQVDASSQSPQQQIKASLNHLNNVLDDRITNNHYIDVIGAEEKGEPLNEKESTRTTKQSPWLQGLFSQKDRKNEKEDYTTASIIDKEDTDISLSENYGDDKNQKRKTSSWFQTFFLRQEDDDTNIDIMSQDDNDDGNKVSKDESDEEINDSSLSNDLDEIRSKRSDNGYTHTVDGGKDVIDTDKKNDSDDVVEMLPDELKPYSDGKLGANVINSKDHQNVTLSEMSSSPEKVRTGWFGFRQRNKEEKKDAVQFDDSSNYVIKRKDSDEEVGMNVASESISSNDGILEADNYEEEDDEQGRTDEKNSEIDISDAILQMVQSNEENDNVDALEQNINNITTSIQNSENVGERSNSIERDGEDMTQKDANDAIDTKEDSEDSEISKDEDDKKKLKSKEKKSKSRMGISLHNALPFLKNRSPKQEVELSGSNTTQSVEEQKEIPPPAEDKVPPPTENIVPPPMQMPLTNPFIFIPPPPPPSQRSLNRQSHQMPNGPVSPTEATLSSLITSLLPLLIRLILLSLLSSSSLLGHGEMNVYSPEPSQHYVFERINDRYLKDSLAMKKALEHPPVSRSKYSWKMSMNKRRKNLQKELIASKKSISDSTSNNAPLIYSRTVIVMDLDTMDTNMDTAVENLRDSISCILRQFHSGARLDMGSQLEVVVCIESPGGVVQDFGLAADQLTRLKEAGEEQGDLILTVCVDKIAASGGYMMACQASPGQLIAAPFAILGSIGVLRETINIHDVLEKYGIRPLMMKAGEAKAPLTSTTKVTKESLQLVQNNLDRVHDAFRDMVSKARKEAIDDKYYDKVTSGDVFLAKHAIEYGLVDRIMSSDEYISERIQAGDRVLKIHKYDKSRVGMRFSPLDLLLLKSNGLLGKKVARSMVNYALKVSPMMFQIATGFGLIQVMERTFSTGTRKQRLEI